jgi:hypothetical protein
MYLFFHHLKFAFEALLIHAWYLQHYHELLGQQIDISLKFIKLFMLYFQKIWLLFNYVKFLLIISHDTYLISIYLFEFDFLMNLLNWQLFYLYFEFILQVTYLSIISNVLLTFLLISIFFPFSFVLEIIILLFFNDLFSCPKFYYYNIIIS